MKCPYCNSEDIETGLRMFDFVGEKQSDGQSGKELMKIVTQIRCDVCKSCKTIVRGYFAETSEK